MRLRCQYHSKGTTRTNNQVIKYYKIRSFSIISLSLLHAASIYSISAPAYLNPFSLEPGLIGRSLDPGLMGQILSKQPQPGSLIPAQDQVVQQNQLATEAVSQISFTLNQVKFSGNKTISTSELVDIFKPYLNKKITVAKLMELVDAATNLYQKRGYFLSKAVLPPQRIDGGIVQVTIVEGFFSDIEIHGVTGRQNSLISSYGDRIKNIVPIEIEGLERTLLIINQIPGFQTKTFIAPDKNTPLGSVLTLKTEYTPVNAYYSHDNFQTRYLGPQENTLHASINSYLIPGGTLSLSSINSDNTSKLQYYEVRHDQLLGTNGLNFTVDGYYTRTHPGFILTPLNVIGYSADVNATLSYPLLEKKRRTMVVQTQFNALESHSTALEQLLYRDKIRDISLSATYHDILWKGEDTALLVFDKGFNILGARDRLEPPLSHPDGSSNFFRINFSANRIQYLSEYLSLYASFTSQYANRPLLAASDFIFGGPMLGRGYDMAQFTGDQGIAGSAEFRVTFPDKIPFIDRSVPYIRNIQCYTFYDVGKLWNFQQNLPSIVTSGASAGAGIRTTVASYVNLSGFVGKPLTTPNATQLVLRENGKAFLGYFQVTAFF